MTTDEYAAITRAMIEHENTLLNHRMTWMWTLQGLLVAAAGVMWGFHSFLVLLICVFGFCSSISVGVSLQSALRAIDSLLSDWTNRVSRDPNYNGPRVIGSPGVRPIISKLQPWNSLPWLMALIWILLAIAKFSIKQTAA